MRVLGDRVAAASLAAILAGVLVAGVLGRVAMRVAGFMARDELLGVRTSNGNEIGVISIEGTVALALFAGIAAGVVGGPLYAAAEPWLRGVRARGPLFGGSILLGFGFTVIDPNNFDFARFGSAPLNVAMFAVLFIAFGVITARMYDAIHRAMGRDGRWPRALRLVAYLALAITVLGAASALAAVLAGGDALPLLLVGIAIVVPPLARIRATPAIGYAGFAVPLVAGGVRTLGAVAALLQ